MAAEHRSIWRDVLHWSVIFACLGAVFFVLGFGAAMWFEDAGLSSNPLAQVLVFGLMWPPYITSTLSDSNWLLPLFYQLLGWGLLGIPLGLWRAKRRSLASVARTLS